MPPAIRVEGLEKDYGDVQALDGLDLTVPEGSFFGLLGPNGAGKTTFINVLVGLVRKTGGRAEVFGNDVEADYQGARDAIGLAPQEFNVDRFFPIEEVLHHKAGYHGVPEAEAEERAVEALKRVGIYDKRDVRFDWLSGGMKRRFMLARALVTDPDLLILDEPTAGVDVELRHDLWEVITDLNDEGTTILLTTHYIEEAERLCDEVAIIDSGRKVTVATPDELTEKGSDTLTVYCERDVGDAPAFDDERVESVTVEGDALRVRATSASEVVPSVLRQLEAAGHTPLDIDIERTSLEEVFVDLTRREEGADDGATSRSSDGAGSGNGDADADGDGDGDERVAAEASR
ncbi:ABC-2 type transport system ATP-binding protein [Halarchaeum rubridurum]|uniref:ABC-2 type transport system ATP-binding protein n=1 Tax=Halarchaeum rubridurum TaxID=489911 RepID=A0A830G395_9EURY|nr:ABC transporter ATP-binding protein [Halarchaeum rubridurum]MBP1955471.1 ABC-2 type transport system ATP-binding protein [Halarchaeum rubridurum]GGM72600.1 multidrug ABC transporter ATP-binding protein [Halarchaeum rubridurum]